MSNPYPYRRLNCSQREIRILRLDPAPQASHELTGSLTHVSLDANASFEALSYTWGQPPFKNKISIDGIVFQIGSNLEAALRQLRKHDACRCIWVDAICINQTDDAERRQQIQEMQTIFSSAKHVLAWLGEAGEHGELAMSLLEGLQEDHVAGFRSSNFSCREWIALKMLWSRPYWKRIWVVQELALGSTRALIGCGRQWIPRCHFERALNILLAHRNNYDTLLWEALESEMDWFLNLSLICRSIAPAGETDQAMLDLENLLYLTEHFEATKPHDHFYALLGLSQQLDRSAIPVDYSGCFAEICARVILHIIHRTSSLNILSGNRSKKEDTLTSWMPSFSDPVRRGYGWNTFRTFRAADRSRAAVTLSPCQRVLGCHGVEVGVLSSIEGPFLNSKLQFLDARRFLAMRRIAASAFLSEQRHALATPMELLDVAFWESLLANRSIGTGDSAADMPSGLSHLSTLLDREDADTTTGLVNIEAELQRCIVPYISNIVSTLRFRCFFATSNGFIGVGSYKSQIGDLAVIFAGADVPFILRRNQGDEFRLVGDAFVYGVMNGELSLEDVASKSEARRALFRLR